MKLGKNKIIAITVVLNVLACVFAVTSFPIPVPL